MLEKKPNNFDVFFCYARHDLNVVRKIYNAIKLAGFNSWLDVDCLMPGVDFLKTIQEELARCKVVIAIISQKSIKSQWFVREVAFAQSIGKVIIPIKIDDSILNSELNFMLANVQFLMYNEDFSNRVLISTLDSIINQRTKVFSRDNAEIEAEIQRLDNYLPQKNDYDIFISYRREGGREFARNLKLQLQILGYQKIFFDYNSIRDGVFNTQILDAIYSCNNFLLLLSPDSMDRCADKGDWVAREIRTAIKYDCKIIPITMQPEFQWPENFPCDLSKVKNIQQHKLLVDEYFETSVERLSERLDTAKKCVKTQREEHLYYYKVISKNARVKVFIDDCEGIAVEQNKLKKIPLQRGEYYVRILSDNESQIFLEKSVCIDQDRVEII